GTRYECYTAEIFRDERVEVTVCRLAIPIAILGIDASVPLVDSLRVTVGALADVFDVPINDEAVQPYQGQELRIVKTELTISFISITIQEPEVQRVTCSLEIK